MPKPGRITHGLYAYPATRATLSEQIASLAEEVGRPTPATLFDPSGTVVVGLMDPATRVRRCAKCGAAYQDMWDFLGHVQAEMAVN